jgi:hypothetical protein
LPRTSLAAMAPSTERASSAIRTASGDVIAARSGPSSPRQTSPSWRPTTTISSPWGRWRSASSRTTRTRAC